MIRKKRRRLNLPGVMKNCTFHKRHCEFASERSQVCRQYHKERIEKEKSRPKIIVLEKTCHECKETKPASDFARDSGRKDGLYIRCRPCKNSMDQRYRDSWQGCIQEQVGKSHRSHGNKLLKNCISYEEAEKLLEGQNIKCDHCGHVLQSETGTPEKKNPWRASLDRKNVDVVGYGNGNAQWLCFSCNAGKGTMPNVEHKEKFAARDRKIEMLRLKTKALEEKLNHFLLEQKKLDQEPYNAGQCRQNQ